MLIQEILDVRYNELRSRTPRVLPLHSARQFEIANYLQKDRKKGSLFKALDDKFEQLPGSFAQ